MLPTTKISIPVNKENAVKYGIVSPEEAPYLEDSLHITIGGSRGNSIDKKTLAFLDFLSNYQWDRPIHFGISARSNAAENMFGLGKYVILEGATYKLVPIEIDNLEACDGLRSYDMITKEWEFGGMDNPKTYLTETDRNMSQNFRLAIDYAARALLMDGDTARAREILELSVNKMPTNLFEPANPWILKTINTLYAAGDKDKADSLARYEFDQLEKDLVYFYSFPEKHRMRVYPYAWYDLMSYDGLLGDIEEENPELFEQKKGYYDKLFRVFVSLYPFILQKN